MSATHVSIQLLPGNVAPRYASKDMELQCDEVIITEQGMQSGLPLLDFVMKDRNGKVFYMVLTGRIVINIAAAVRGVNYRNHGVEEL